MVAKGLDLAVVTLNLSQGGIAVRVPTPIAPGELCVVALDLPITDRRKRFNAWGTAVYCELFGDAYRLGIQFGDVDARSLFCLQELERETGVLQVQPS